MSNHYEEKEQDLPQSKQPKLRLDFFLSLGLELSERDSLWNDFYGELVISSQNEKVTDCNVNRSLITYLAPRQNIGVQPCNGIVPIVWTLTCGSNYKGKAYETAWRLCHNKPIDTWKPDLDALIKMQNEHDAKQKVFIHSSIKNARVYNKALSDEEIALIDLSEDQASKNLLEAVLEVDNSKPYIQSIECDFNGGLKTEKVSPLQFDHDGRSKILNTLNKALKMNKEQPVFTRDCKGLIKTPNIDMLCRVEYLCRSRDKKVIDTITFKFESDKEYCGLDDKGFCFGIDKDDFIAWHAIDERSELDIAKEKQLQECLLIAQKGRPCSIMEIFKDMQEHGMLAEIVLGLK